MTEKSITLRAAESETATVKKSGTEISIYIRSAGISGTLTVSEDVILKRRSRIPTSLTTSRWHSWNLSRLPRPTTDRTSVASQTRSEFEIWVPLKQFALLRQWLPVGHPSRRRRPGGHFSRPGSPVGIDPSLGYRGVIADVAFGGGARPFLH